MTAPSTQELRDHLLPLLTAAGWTDPAESMTGQQFYRDGQAVELVDGRVLVLVAGTRESGYGRAGAEIVAVDVTSVEQAVAYLRVAGVLPAEPDYKPALVDSLGWRWYYVGQGEYVEKLTKEVWPLRALETRRGPLTECPTDPGWSRRPDGPAVTR